uniref:collectin-10-like n=1 Tax=Styela clava TaxID=7725 RepID=UPI0019393514|nr:collectin-10-like [Styela clava]
MHLYCTNSDQHSVLTDQTVFRGKAGPRGPPGEVEYHIINETIKDYLTDISGEIQAKLTQIGPIVEKSSEDIEDLKAASGHTQTKLTEIETDIGGLKSVMAQMQEHLETLIWASRGITNIRTWYRAGNNNYYKLFSDLVTYAVAKANCKRLGGQLASAGYRDEDIRREILPLVKSGRSHAWIGLNDIRQENTFIWEDGVTANVSSVPWHDGEPNNHGGNEDCVDIASGFDWELNDNTCSVKNKYLCELEALFGI